MSLPIENEHHVQILVRIGPTVVATSILVSNDLRGQIWSPISWGPEQLLFSATF